jgi:hypothetical protein
MNYLIIGNIGEPLGVMILVTGRSPLTLAQPAKKEQPEP